MSRRRWTRVLGTLAGALLMALAGCGDPERSASLSVGGAGTVPAGGHPGTGGRSGTLVGSVRFRGPIPAPEPVRVNHTADRTVCGEVQVSESLRIGAGGGLRDAVVSLEFDSAPAPAAGEAPAVMVRIRNCRFEPHSLLVPRGGEVFFRNEDRIRHRITATGPDGLPRFEITLPRRGVQISRRLDSTPRLVLGGVDRPWMSGVVWVTGHPFAGVTDAEGRFRLAGVPPGRHRLRAWHPALGETSAEVMARAGEETVVRLILPPGA